MQSKVVVAGLVLALGLLAGSAFAQRAFSVMEPSGRREDRTALRAYDGIGERLENSRGTAGRFTSPVLAGVQTLDGKLTVLEPAQLAVYDADGTKVSEVIGVGDAMERVLVALKVNGYAFALWVRQDGFEGNATGPYFETTDCSGTPFVSSVFSPLPSVAVSGPGSIVYLADPGGTSQLSNSSSAPLLRVRSMLVRVDINSATEPLTYSYDECVTPPGEKYLEASPALALIDLDAYFTPPFSVR